MISFVFRACVQTASAKIRVLEDGLDSYYCNLCPNFRLPYTCSLSKPGKTPVLDVGALERIRNGCIKVVPAVKCFTSCGAKFIDGQEIEFDSVILATGYTSNVPSWLKECDFFTQDGMPKKFRGPSR